MKPLKEFFIPKDYTDELKDLTDKSFAWKMEFSSKTELATTGHITHYSINDVKPLGNLVLVPGLASNTQIEPMMRAVTYWALKHKFNIYAIDSFLGDFKPEISKDFADKNTLPEFIDLMDVGLEIVSKMSVNQWTCVIGHSLGGTGVLEVFNRRVLANQPIGFSAAVLFAPFVVKDFRVAMKKILKERQYADLSEEEYATRPVGLVSPHDIWNNDRVGYISIYPSFYDIDTLNRMRPEIMAKYDIPITLVAGGKDRKAPIESIRALYNNVLEYSNNPTIKLVEFPKSKHSFIDQHNDWEAVLRLIKSQHVRIRKSKSK